MSYDCRRLRMPFKIALLLIVVGCSTEPPTAFGPNERWDLVGRRGSTGAPIDIMTAVGCTPLEGPSHVGVVGIKRPGGGIAKFECADVDRDTVNAALVRYYKALKVLGNEVSQTAVLSGDHGWDPPAPPDDNGVWVSEEIMVPTGQYDCQVNTYTTTYVDVEAGIYFVAVVTNYYCETLYAVGHRWIPGQPEEPPPPPPPPPSLSISCSNLAPVRGASVTCSAGSSAGSVTAADWSFVPDSAPVGTLSASTLGHSTSLSGPVVTSGRLVLFGTVDSIPATSDTVHVVVSPRSTGFAWGTPQKNGSVSDTCIPYLNGTAWGWTAVHGTCDASQTLYPNPNETDAGVTVSQVTSGINKSLYYVTSLVTHVWVGFNVVPELYDAGGTFTMGIADSSYSAFNCHVGSTPSTFGAVNACMNNSSTWSSFQSAIVAHERCHVDADVDHYNTGKTGKAAAAPARVEAAVSKNASLASNVATFILKPAGVDIAAVGIDGLDAPGAPGYYVHRYVPQWQRWGAPSQGSRGC